MKADRRSNQSVRIPLFLERQRAVIDEAAHIVPQVTFDDVPLARWQFLPRNDREKRLSLSDGFFQAVEVISDFVAMQAAAIIDVEIVERHAAPPSFVAGHKPSLVAIGYAAV